MIGKLNIGTRTAVVGRHSGVNELTVHFIKKNEDATIASNKASVPPSANISRRSCRGVLSRWRRLWGASLEDEGCRKACQLTV